MHIYNHIHIHKECACEKVQRERERERVSRQHKVISRYRGLSYECNSERKTIRCRLGAWCEQSLSDIR